MKIKTEKRSLIAALTMVLFAMSCNKDPELIGQAFFSKVPIVTIGSVYGVTANAAKANGSIENTNDTEGVISHGHCWSASDSLPTFNNEHTDLGDSDTALVFISELVNLAPSTTYYVRAFAENQYGIGYSPTIVFATSSTNAIGEVIFWVSADPGCGYIEVTIDDGYSGDITGFYSSGTPDCGDQYGDQYGVTASLSAGAHTFSAQCQGSNWADSFVIEENGCLAIKIF